MQLSERIGRRIKLQDLHVLMTVVEAGSMKKAAARLNTSQPAVSRSIADLEQMIGVLLLERNPRGVEPTEYGRMLLKHGSLALGELKEGLKNIEFLAEPTAGEVRIGTSAFLAVSFITAVVDRLSRRYPRIVFNIVTGTAGLLYRELDQRNVDLLVIRKLGSATDEKLNFEALFYDSFVIAAGAQSRWAGRRKIELSELVGEPWVLPTPESEMALVAREAFGACRLDCPQPTVLAVAPELRISLLIPGRFLSIFPLSALRFPVQRPGIKVLPVKLMVPSAAIGTVVLKHRTLSPVARLFVDEARAVAKSLANRQR